MKYTWADGFHAPKDVSADDVKASIDSLKDRSPSGLLEASKAKKHPLHGALWSEGDQIWATRARTDYCRKVMSSICEVEVKGGKEITHRAYEFIRKNGEGSWATIGEISNNTDLRKSYFNEIKRLQEQALHKMERYHSLFDNE
jgi:hypothetical protein